MRKLVTTSLYLGLLAVPGIAQNTQLHSEVENTLRSKGVEVQVPTDLSNEQYAQLLAIANNRGLNRIEMQQQVEKIVGK